MWLNGRASASQAEGCEFESRHPLHFFADVAQLVEQLIRNQQVEGSSPSVSSNTQTKVLSPSQRLSTFFRAIELFSTLPWLFL